MDCIDITLVIGHSQDDQFQVYILFEFQPELCITGISKDDIASFGPVRVNPFRNMFHSTNLIAVSGLQLIIGPAANPAHTKDNRLDMTQINLGIQGVSPFGFQDPEDMTELLIYTLCKEAQGRRHSKTDANG